MELTPEQEHVFRSRIAHSPDETFEQMCERVVEVVCPASRNEPARGEMLRILVQRKFILNTPALAGAGTKMGQLAACFVLPISDDLTKSEDSIFSTLRKAAAIQQTGGGVGFNFSPLRPKGALISSSNGPSSGPVSFIEVFDTAFSKIEQGGTRRGANMAILNVDHPDILEFIRRKKNTETEIKAFNFSVGVTEDFIRAVQKGDKEFPLQFGGKVYRTVDPKELLHEIAEAAWSKGEPGVVFLDRINAENPLSQVYTIQATNPCVEARSTLVTTPSGVRRMSDMMACEDGCDVSVSRPCLPRDGMDGDSPVVRQSQSASRVFSTGRKRVVRLRTEEGPSLVLTPDHRCCLARTFENKRTTEAAAPVWQEAGKLVPGDRLQCANVPAGFGGLSKASRAFKVGILAGMAIVNAPPGCNREEMARFVTELERSLSATLPGQDGGVVPELRSMGLVSQVVPSVQDSESGALLFNVDPCNFLAGRDPNFLMGVASGAVSSGSRYRSDPGLAEI